MAVATIQSVLGNTKWRIAICTVFGLLLLHFIFVDDTLRNAYAPEAVAKVAPPVAPVETAPPLPGVEAPSPVTAVEAAPVACTNTTAPPVWPPMPKPKSIPPFESGDNGGYLAICLVTKDQYPDLTEWLVHHYHHHGIRRFYIMDDGSSPMLATLDYSEFIDPKAITHRYYPKEILKQNFHQQVMYDECMKLYGHKHKWMAFIDTDEFFETKGGETIYDILKKFDEDEKVGALGVNWEIHTSGGLLTRPESSRKAFTTCIQDIEKEPYPKVGLKNQHIKTIVKTSKYAGMQTVHSVNVKEGSVVVGEHGDTITRGAWRIPTTRDRISLHHYASKSKEQFEAKIHRGNAMNDPKTWDWWNEHENYPNRTCDSMTKYDP